MTGETPLGSGVADPLLAAVAVGVLRFDAKGRLKQANPAALKLNRLLRGALVRVGSRRSANTPLRILDPQTGETSALTEHPVAAAVRTGESQTECILGRPGRRGGPAWVRIDVVPVRDDAGAISDLMVTALDLTAPLVVEARLRESLREKELLLKEVYHRVKNNLQLITSLVNMQVRQAGARSPAAELEAFGQRVAALCLVHEQLYRSENLARVDLLAYARELSANLVRGIGPNESAHEIRVAGDPVELELGRAIPFGLILHELVTNAVKHGLGPSARGWVAVDLRASPRRLVLRVTDRGPMGAAAVAAAQPGSLGLRIVRALAQQLGGRVSWTGRRRVTARLAIPLAGSA